MTTRGAPSVRFGLAPILRRVVARAALAAHARDLSLATFSDSGWAELLSDPDEVERCLDTTVAAAIAAAPVGSELAVFTLVRGVDVGVLVCPWRGGVVVGERTEVRFPLA